MPDEAGRATGGKVDCQLSRGMVYLFGQKKVEIWDFSHSGHKIMVNCTSSLKFSYLVLL